MIEPLTVLALFLIVPAILGFFQCDKDQVGLYLLASLALVAIYMSLYPFIGQFQHWFPAYGFFNKFVSLVALTLTIILALRLKNRLLTGMMITAASVAMLGAFQIVRHIWA